MNPHLERGRLLLLQHRPAEAEKELRQALAADPDDAIALALLSECYLDTNRYPDALDAARQAIARMPEIPFLYYVLARAHYYNKQMREARQAIAEGQRLDPSDPEAFHLLATVEFYDEKWQAALDAAQRGLELDPENVNLINLRAQSLIRLNRKQEAAQALDFALQKAPQNAFAHANKGWVAIEQDQYELAVSHFREALRLQPNNDFARSGLKEAIKGKNLLYRAVLKYFLWMNKLTEQGRWVFIIGAYLGYRIFFKLAENYPDLAPFLYPFIALYIVFAFSSWIAKPVSNLFLRLHPLGKYALDEDEIKATNAVGLLGAAAILTGTGGYLGGMGLLVLLGLLMGVMLIPVSGMFNVHPRSRARRYLLYYALLLAAMALAGLALPWAILGFAVGIFVYGWVANYLISRDAGEFY